MTRFDAIRRQLSDIEKNHERALAKREMQIRLLCGYRDQLEDQFDIAVEMFSDAYCCSKDVAGKLIDDAYEARQAARKAAGEA